MKSLSGHRHDGHEKYFCEGITWTFVSTHNFGVRYSSSGFVFDVAGSTMFLAHNMINYVCGLLCSKMGSYFMSIQNPTMNFQVGNLRQVPVIIEEKETVDLLSEENITLEKQDWDSFETSWDFGRHPLI
jgi:hypothetical protein